MAALGSGEQAYEERVRLAPVIHPRVPLAPLCENLLELSHKGDKAEISEIVEEIRLQVRTVAPPRGLRCRRAGPARRLQSLATGRGL